MLLSALLVAALGALLEMLVLRRLYGAPELYQLLATFALVLVVRDAALWAWGPEDLLGPKAPGMRGAIDIVGQPFPSYDVFSIFVGPVVLGALWLLLRRTRWGLLVRAATQDREMVGALGVNQRWLFTSVFALGTFLAALGGALQMPHEPANLNLDLALIGEAFVVVVVGGMGSIGGAFVAAILIAMVKAVCIAAGTVDVFGAPFPLSKLTLVAEFLVMAIVLVWRPSGLFGKPQGIVRATAAIEAPLRPLPAPWRRAGVAALVALALVALLGGSAPYAIVLMIDVLIAVLFAASLHFLIGPSGMHSFGHAAYFGLGAYGAALCFKALGLPMEASLVLAPLLAALGAFVFGWFCVRLSGVYLAMLTLAFAQIVWSVVFQWDPVTGGSNGLVGIWPAPWLAPKPAYYLLVLAFTVAGAGLLVRMLHAPIGLALRGSRDSPLRAAAIGIGVPRLQWIAFVVAGTVAGLAGALLRVREGNDLARDARRRQVGRRSRHGPARRRPCALGSVARRRALHLAAGHGRPPDRLLACPAGRRHARADPRLSTRCRRRVEAAVHPRGVAGMTTVPLLAVRDLAKSFGGVRAVDRVGFDLGAGEMLALIGPNGAGKTTCFNMVGGQLAADAGSVRLGGVELLGLKPESIWRHGVGRTFQIAETFASLTVRENVQLALLSHARRVLAWWRPARVQFAAEADALLASVGMAEQATRAMSVLAYGDVKRVELAIALANRPRLLLMDEPTAGMAPRERNELMALARRLAHEQSIGVLFTEHSMDVVFAHADRIIVLARGELIAEGPPAAVRDDARVREVYFGGGTTFAAPLVEASDA